MEPAPSLETAYAHCAAIAKDHYENFSVASLLLPRGLRPAFYTLYAYCRHTDDLGDEAKGNRLALLEEWERELVRVYGGEPTDPIMVALQDVVRRFGIPDEPFRKLIQANRMDQGRVRDRVGAQRHISQSSLHIVRQDTRVHHPRRGRPR